MKAILVINMPKSCWECPCYDGYWQCGATGNGFDTQDEIHNQRPDWCPLKPMPEKLEPKLSVVVTISERENDIYLTAYDVGWNDCLDEIGEEK